VSQVTLLGGLGMGGARSYGGLVEEESRLKLWCGNHDYIKDVLRKILAFKVNQKSKESFINFSMKLFLS